MRRTPRPVTDPPYRMPPPAIRATAPWAERSPPGQPMRARTADRMRRRLLIRSRHLLGHRGRAARVSFHSRVSTTPQGTARWSSAMYSGRRRSSELGVAHNTGTLARGGTCSASCRVWDAGLDFRRRGHAEQQQPAGIGRHDRVTDGSAHLHRRRPGRPAFVDRTSTTATGTLTR